jgi:mevalonate kinase
VSSSNGSGSTAVGHGKVILLGEHAVVYGCPAIAVGIPRGCHATAEPAQVDTLSVEPWGVQVQASSAPTAANESEDRAMLRRAFALLCERYPQPRPALHVRASMQIPGGAGLGGSAALSVAIVRALDAALGVTQSVDAIIDASLAWERVFHGNPSGVDSAMAARGGLAVYRRGQPLAALKLAKPLVFVVGYSGDHGSTKAMVESVARQHARDPEKTQQIFDAVESLVNNAQSALANGDYPRLGQLFDLNQKLLNTLMLSTTKLETMCNLARDAGALGAKLTGGGGGGSMIALALDAAHAQPIATKLRDAGYEAFVVEVPRSATELDREVAP